MSSVLETLEQILIERQSASPDASYVSQLYHKGLNKIVEKIGEEATELVIAAKDCEHDPDSHRSHVVSETADLWFHSMVALTHLGISPREVLAELDRRFAQSGLEEKANRS